jgi:lipoprotein-anchoring transpeptidase ErfK/SrfK
MTSRLSRRTWTAIAVLVPTLTLAASRDARETVAHVFAPKAEATASTRLSADLSKRQLYLWKGGEVSQSYAVAVGKPGNPTPRGTFTIKRIVWNPGWVPPDEPWAKGKKAKNPGDKGNPMRVAKIFFREPDYYIHGTPHTGSLGSAASHGCLRMDPDQVAQLAHQVMNAGGVARDWSWVKATLRMGSTRTVHLKRPVTITIVS